MGLPIYTEIKRQIESGLLVKTEGCSKEGLEFCIRGFTSSDPIPTLTIVRRNIVYGRGFQTMMLDLGRELATPVEYFEKITTYKKGDLEHATREPLKAEIRFWQYGNSDLGTVSIKMDLLTQRGEFIRAPHLNIIAGIESSIANYTQE